MKRTYKFRTYPPRKQKETLNRQMFLAKELYNLLLDQSKTYYKGTKKTLTEYRMNVWITKLKKERPEFHELYSQVLQNVSKRISDAYKSYFRRCKEKKAGKKVKVGFPRYKKFVSSLTYPQEGGFQVEKKRANLSKIGRINIVNHREIEGIPKTCTIKKSKSGEWCISISTEKEDVIPFTNGKPAIGLDLGLAQFATLSDNTITQNAKTTKRQRKHIKNLQQDISRKRKGSHNRKKAVKRFAKWMEHIIKIKEDRLHQLSHQLVNSYSFIAYEDLNIQNMVKNHRLARAIGESSWGNFTQLLQYKAASAGCAAVAVNPQYTSMTCNECQNVQEISLLQRTFVCKRCNHIEDRDINAAMNILKRATEGQSGSDASGDHVRPSVREAIAVERGTIQAAS